jgi:NADPH:quinone reductase-like Zn-dependent oxidoreductase
MKALVKKEAAPGLWLEDVPEPEPGANDVLIKVKRTAICGTDLHIYKWDEWAQKTIPVPMVVGHEFVGEIVEVGDNVNDYAPGMIVSGEGHIVCGAAATAWPAGDICARSPAASASIATAPLPNMSRSPTPMSGTMPTASTSTSPRCSIRSATLSTPRCNGT